MRIAPFLLLAAVLTIPSPVARAQETPAPADRDLVYVCNQGEATVAVIDAATLAVETVIDLTALGYPASAKPHHVVVEPDGAHWYVSLIGANRVLRFDRDNQVVGIAEFEVPGMLALHPDGETLFVGRSMSAVNPPQSIGMIRIADMTVEELDVFFPRPHALAVSADGATVYSASLTENRMIAIDLATGDGTFTTFDGPVHTLVQFGVSPVDGSLVAGGQMTGRVFRLSGAAAGEGARVTASIVGEAQPWHPVFDAAGRFAYIPNKGVNGVSVFDAAADSVVAVIHGPGLAQPHGSALSADGRHLFVSNQNMDGSYVPEQPHVHREDHSGMHEMPGMSGKASLPGTVVVIDTQTREVVRVIEVGMTPSGVGSRGPR